MKGKAKTEDGLLHRCYGDLRGRRHFRRKGLGRIRLGGEILGHSAEEVPYLLGALSLAVYETPASHSNQKMLQHLPPIHMMALIGPS